MFVYCTCGHTTEDHAMEEPPEEQECNYVDGDMICSCSQFEKANEEEVL